MTALLPILPGQIERWSQTRPEPVTLDLPGWTATVHEPNATFPNQRSIRFTRGGATVDVMRYWDMPRNPGHPMAVASQREITVGGRTTELLTTSVFDGFPKQVKVC